MKIREQIKYLKEYRRDLIEYSKRRIEEIIKQMDLETQNRFMPLDGYEEKLDKPKVKVLTLNR